MSRQGKLYIFGYSGHAYVVLEGALSMDFSIRGYFDRAEASLNPYKLLYLGDENEFDFDDLEPDAFYFPAIGNHVVREKIIQMLEAKDLKIATIIHKSSIVSSYSSIDAGSFIGPGTVINSQVVIGKGAIINSGSIIEHDCIIGDYTHVAPGAVLAGNVDMGNKCFVGTNAAIKDGIIVADEVVIGAGAVVLNNIDRNQTWVGNPARRIK